MFYPWFKPERVLDTLVWAKTVIHDVFDITVRSKWKRNLPKELWSAHSLKAWGLRIGEHKDTPPTDWKVFTPEMLDYCEQDVVTTGALFEYFKNKWTTSDEAVELEMWIAQMLWEQEQYGVCFDTTKATRLYAKLQSELDVLRQQLHQWFPLSTTKNWAAF